MKADQPADPRGLPEALPVLAEGMAVRSMSWPMVVQTETQAECVSDGLLSEREVVDITDVSRDIKCLPDAFPVLLTSYLNVEMGPQADEGPDVVMAGWNMESDDTGAIQDSQLRTDVCLMMFEDSAAEPMSLPVVVNTVTQVDVRWESTSVVVPSSDGSGRPAGWLDTESD